MNGTRSIKIVLAMALSIAAVGCGGREAKPVSITNPNDGNFDCAAIAREYAANERQIISTIKERKQARGKNIILGTTGAVLFVPALFFIDPKSPERVEINALRNRNLVLEELASSKGCGSPRSQLNNVYKALDRSEQK